MADYVRLSRTCSLWLEDHLSSWEWSNRLFWVWWRATKTPLQHALKTHCPENTRAETTCPKNNYGTNTTMWQWLARLVEVQLIPTSSSTISCNSSLNPLPARSPRCLTPSLTAIGRLWRGWLGQVMLGPAWSFQMHCYALMPMKLWFLWGVIFDRLVITAPGRIF